MTESDQTALMCVQAALGFHYFNLLWRPFCILWLYEVAVSWGTYSLIAFLLSSNIEGNVKHLIIIIPHGLILPK